MELPLIKKKKKWLPKISLGQKFFIIIGSILILFLVAILYLFYDFKYAKGSIYLVDIPQDAKILVNNKEYPYKESLKIKLPRGEYTVRIEKENFWPFEETIEITAGHQIIKIKPNLVALSAPVKIAKNIKYPGILIQDARNYFLYAYDGYLFVMRLDDLKKERISSFLANLNYVFWNQNKKLVLIQQGSYTRLLDFSYSGLMEPAIINLGRSKNAVFSFQGEKLAYLARKGKRNFLATRDLLNDQENLLIDLEKISSAKIGFLPNESQIILLPQLKRYGENFLYLINLYTRQMKQVTSRGNIIGFLAGPDSQKILFSRYDGKSPTKSRLYLVELNLSTNSGHKEKDLEILVPIKNCAWVDSNVFLYADTDGKLFKYNINIGQKSEVYYPQIVEGEKLMPSNLLLYPDRKNLIFQSGKNVYWLKGTF